MGTPADRYPPADLSTPVANLCLNREERSLKLREPCGSMLRCATAQPLSTGPNTSLALMLHTQISLPHSSQRPARAVHGKPRPESQSCLRPSPKRSQGLMYLSVSLHLYYSATYRLSFVHRRPCRSIVLWDLLGFRSFRRNTPPLSPAQRIPIFYGYLLPRIWDETIDAKIYPNLSEFCRCCPSISAHR